MLTYIDAVSHVIDYLSGGMSDMVKRDAARVVQAAYAELATIHPWTYLYTRGRLITDVPYSTGTVDYDHTGGASERLMTLTGGTWPSWAGYGDIRIGQAMYRVGKRLSGTQLQIDAVLCPSEDINDSTYTLYRESYPLPTDFSSQDSLIRSIGLFSRMEYVHPRDVNAAASQCWRQGDARWYTILPDARHLVPLSLSIWPTPPTTTAIDYLYRRSPRALSLMVASSGTLAMTANATTVTASTSVFTSAMVGSVIRVFLGSTVPPEGGLYGGATVHEAVIKEVASGTSATLAVAAPSTVAAAPYLISDPIDIDLHAMRNVFLRGCEMQAGLTRTLKDKPSAKAAYDVALGLARDADSRSFSRRVVGEPVTTGWAWREPVNDFTDQ